MEAAPSQAAPSHPTAWGTQAPRAPPRLGRSGKLHLFPKLSSFLALFAFSRQLLKPRYYFRLGPKPPPMKSSPPTSSPASLPLPVTNPLSVPPNPSPRRQLDHATHRFQRSKPRVQSLPMTRGLGLLPLPAIQFILILPNVNLA